MLALNCNNRMYSKYLEEINLPTYLVDGEGQHPLPHTKGDIDDSGKIAEEGGLSSKTLRLAPKLAKQVALH